MSGRLQDKVCVITGAASGIGAETAREFAAEGATVVGIDVREGAEGALSLQADVSDEEHVRSMYTRAREEFGQNPDDAKVRDATTVERYDPAWNLEEDAPEPRNEPHHPELRDQV